MANHSKCNLRNKPIITRKQEYAVATREARKNIPGVRRGKTENGTKRDTPSAQRKKPQESQVTIDFGFAPEWQNNERFCSDWLTGTLYTNFDQSQRLKLIFKTDYFLKSPQRKSRRASLANPEVDGKK